MNVSQFRAYNYIIFLTLSNYMHIIVVLVINLVYCQFYRIAQVPCIVIAQSVFIGVDKCFHRYDILREYTKWLVRLYT